MFEALSRITILIDGRKAYVDCCSHPAGAVSQLMAKYPPEDASLILAETMGEDGRTCAVSHTAHFVLFALVTALNVKTVQRSCDGQQKL